MIGFSHTLQQICDQNVGVRLRVGLISHNPLSTMLSRPALEKQVCFLTVLLRFSHLVSDCTLDKMTDFLALAQTEALCLESKLYKKNTKKYIIKAQQGSVSSS